MIKTSLKWTVGEGEWCVSISINGKAEPMPCLENIINRPVSKVWSRRGSWEPASTKRWEYWLIATSTSIWTFLRVLSSWLKLLCEWRFLRIAQCTIYLVEWGPCSVSAYLRKCVCTEFWLVLRVFLCLNCENFHNLQISQLLSPWGFTTFWIT